MPSPPSDSPKPLDPDAGNQARATDEYADLVYSDLLRRAERLLAHQTPGGSWCPTELVNECFVKLGKRHADSFADRDHFARTAAVAMRHILVDHIRRKQRLKRGGANGKEDFDVSILAADGRALDLVELDDALTTLAGFDPVMASAVELRTFSGCSLADTARIVGLTEHEFHKRWSATRSWLFKRLS